MLSISTGHDVGYLTKAVAQAREGYYTGAVAAGEPPGLWFGKGAEALGLGGEVDADLMEAVYTHLLDPRDPAAGARSTWGEAAPLAQGHRKYRTADQVYEALLETNPGAGPERRAELRALAERSARQAVSFLDVTFSAPKSVTVLAVAFERAANDAAAAGDHEAAAALSMHAKTVEDAVMAGARAAIEYLQEHAGYSRVGHHGGGAGRWVDAHEFVVAQFLQHDSRDRDPQLHVHQAILNRVLCADGVWRALDSRAIHALRGAAGAVGERVMEAYLTRALGVEFATRPDGKAREVLGVPQEVIELFSSRRRAVSARTEELIRQFRETAGREPSPAERYYFAQQATLATRAAKSHEGETREQQLARWTEQCREIIAGGLARVAEDVLGRAQHAEDAAAWSPRDVIERALAAVSESNQAWSRSALMRAISDALPGNLRIDPEQVAPLLESLTDAALARAVPVTAADDTTNLPSCELLGNGQSPYTAPTGALYTTDGQCSAEHALRAAAVERGAVAVPAAVAERLAARFAESGVTLGADQAAALRGVLTSGARVEVLLAAAGTGKSFVVGAIADSWTHTGDPDALPRRVFGLAPYQVAADVLAGEGLTTKNVAAWLAAQRRLDHPSGRSEDERWRLRSGDLVVVDEAGTATTTDLVEIGQRCRDAGAKLLLAGDPRQLTAIGPGGALADISERGITYQLTEVRRFREAWEGPASLRLRDGDASVLAEYAKHGRLVDAGTAEQAEAAASRAWLADTLSGKESLLLVGTNAAAARVSAALRAELVALGHVEEDGVALGMAEWEGVTVGVGDLVQARALAWHLHGWEGNTAAPITRQTYRVTALRPDGGLTVAPILDRATDQPGTDAPADRNAWGERLGAPMQLPADYVREHLSLGYASTRDAAQGRTVDTSHSVNGPGGGAAGVYVPGTRGREANTFYVVTRHLAPDAETGQTLTVVERTAQAVLAEVIEGERAERTALAEREQADLDARSTMTHVDRLIDVVAREVTAGRAAATLDRLTAEGALTAHQREALAADDAFGSLERLLRTAELAGHNPDAVLTAAVTDERGLRDARSPAQVLHHRITTSLTGRLTPNIADVADLIPAATPPEWRAWLTDRAEAATERRHELGALTAEQAPPWAVDALGSVPDDILARQEWERRAGWAAAYRELVGYTDERDPLGFAPAPALAEKAALFRAAHRELGLLDVGAEEASLSDGQLRARVTGYAREEAWAPRYVDDELEATRRALETARADAVIWAARADAPDTDPTSAQQLRDAADQAQQDAAALADRVSALEAADQARAAWYVHTAVSREKAHRSATELRARGIDPTEAAGRVTAQEWIDAHHAEQADADLDREIHEDYELADDEPRDVDQTRSPDRRTHITVEQPPVDIRDTATVDLTEHTDPTARRRVPTVDEAAEAVARSQAALAEIAARHDTDSARAQREATEQARLDELVRWHHDDTTQHEQHDVDHRTGRPDEAMLER
ncbi:MobF family relaxase [Pseudonocardia sp.]|uniref:MobF family relaxase n=1 Tax=Pseudonocardia sp. TaxID=60912 RepID=UPI003D1146E7